MLRSVGGKWVDLDRDAHGLGRVPVVMFLNRADPGEFVGESEFSDVIPLEDMACRAIVNLQMAMETHAVPHKWVTGVTRGEFMGPDGRPTAAWESAMNTLWATGNKDAKIGQLPQTDLRNFHDTIGMLAQQVSAVTGLPMRYFGQNPANPAAEGAIRADESRMVKNAERKMSAFGDAWGWVMGLVERFRSGQWVDGNRIRVEWHDANTPTVAQRTDALTKLAGGERILSREGVWDELGWTPARKSKERDYFASEAADPLFTGRLVKPDDAALG